MIRYIILFSVLFLFIPVADASTGNTGFFAPILDFFDWVSDSLKNIGTIIVTWLLKMVIYFQLLYFEMKLATVQFVWGIVLPIIQSLNLTDVISAAFSGLSPDIQAFITQIRLGEGINILSSAYLTRMILNFIW